MTTISLRQVPDFVSRRQPFKCNKSLFAEQIGKAYVVYSYGKHFPVAAFGEDLGGWAVNTDRYSPTTSRHQSTVRRGIPSDAVQLDTAHITAWAKASI